MALIYIVEDDKSIQEIEAFALSGAGYQARGFDCAADFYHALKEETPDLVLLDVMLPDEDGLAVVRKLRSCRDTELLPVIMVTARTAELDKVKGLDMGADDYLSKPFGVMELISRVKAMLRRSQAGQKEKELAVGEVVMKPEKRMVTVHGIICDLTYKEYELLRLLLSNTGMVLTRDVILDRIWGIGFEGESRTLDMHIKTLRQKLGDQGCRIRTVRNVGYIME